MIDLQELPEHKPERSTLRWLLNILSPLAILVLLATIAAMVQAFI